MRSLSPGAGEQLTGSDEDAIQQFSVEDFGNNQDEMIPGAARMRALSPRADAQLNQLVTPQNVVNEDAAPAQNVGPFIIVGEQGPQGEPGEAGDKTYVHVQNSASATWVIFHNLDKFPSITIVDSGGDVVEGDISYIDNNTAMAEFSVPFGGKAYCN